MYKKIRKTKKELKELAMLYRYSDLGGFRYNNEYEPIIDLAYKYNITQLKVMEKENNNKRREIGERRKEHVKKHGSAWTPTLSAIMADIGKNAEKSLNITYAQDLLKIFTERHVFDVIVE